MVRRVYVEKKPALRLEAQGLLTELQTILGVSALTGLGSDRIAVVKWQSTPAAAEQESINR